MSKQIEHAYLSKNGGRKFYLQFHIKPWMKQLPWFHSYLAKYPNRKNFKKSLETASLREALERLDFELACTGLMVSGDDQTLRPIPSKNPAPSQPLSEEAEYFRALIDTAKLSAADLYYQIDPAHPDAPTLPREMEQELFIEAYEDPTTNPSEKLRLANAHRGRMKAYDRTASKEDQKRFSAPHPYEATLLSGAKSLVSDYQDRRKDKKDTAKINTAVRKFLGWLGEADISLASITPQIAKRYFVDSQNQEVPKNTFSAEVGKLTQIYHLAQEEGRLTPNQVSPFAQVKLRNYKFKDSIKKAIYTIQHAEILAKEAAEQDKIEILITVAVSYYTGMRSEELYNCTLEQQDGLMYFDIAKGKTSSSVRKVPLHSHLQGWLESTGLIPEYGRSFEWASPSKNAFNKSFNRFNKKYLLEKHCISEAEGQLSHHSFRHGMGARLHKKYDELRVAFVLGHSKKTVSRTESGRTYIKTDDLLELQKIVESVPSIRLPHIKRMRSN